MYVYILCSLCGLFTFPLFTSIIKPSRRGLHPAHVFSLARFRDRNHAGVVAVNHTALKSKNPTISTTNQRHDHTNSRTDNIKFLEHILRINDRTE